MTYASRSTRSSPHSTMRFKSGSYTPLSPEDNGMEGNSSVRRSSKWRTMLSSGIIVVQGLLNFCLLVALLSAVSRIQSKASTNVEICKDVLYCEFALPVYVAVDILTTSSHAR